MPTEESNASAVSSAYSFVTSKWKRSDSMIWLPIRITGFSDVIGSWKTIDICVPQYLRISLPVLLPISWPSKWMLP